MRPVRGTPCPSTTAKARLTAGLRTGGVGAATSRCMGHAATIRRRRGGGAKRPWRRTQIQANPLQDLPIAVLSHFNVLERTKGKNQRLSAEHDLAVGRMLDSCLEVNKGSTGCGFWPTIPTSIAGAFDEIVSDSRRPAGGAPRERPTDPAPACCGRGAAATRQGSGTPTPPPFRVEQQGTRMERTGRQLRRTRESLRRTGKALALIWRLSRRSSQISVGGGGGSDRPLRQVFPVQRSYGRPDRGAGSTRHRPAGPPRGPRSRRPKAGLNPEGRRAPIDPPHWRRFIFSEFHPRWPAQRIRLRVGLFGRSLERASPWRLRNVFT